VSNSAEVMRDTPPEDSVKSLQDNEQMENVFSRKPTPPKVKALGIHWDIAKDDMYIEAPLTRESTEWNKLNVLSLVHKFNDIHGMLVPLMLTPRLLLQECWSRKIGWSDLMTEQMIQ
jgi:hypothetical protein